MIRLKNEPVVVAGDDLTLKVVFTCSDETYRWKAGDRAELLLHFCNGERSIAPCAYDENAAVFYLSGAETEELLEASPDGICRICVRVYWSDGGRSTPIYRRPLWIARC